MDKLIRIYKEALPIYILLTYGIGYIFLGVYYSTFNIDIEYYFSITDFLLFSISILINFSIFLLIVQAIIKGPVYSLAQIDYEKLEKENNYSEIYKREANAELIASAFTIIAAAIASYLTDLDFIIFISTIVTLGINLTIAINKYDLINKKKIETSKRYSFLTMIIGAVLFIAAFFFGWIEAKKAKRNSSFLFSKSIKFKIEDEIVSTNDSIFYIGESSAYVFLYNKNNTSTLIYNKQNIRNLEIKVDSIYIK